MFIQCQNCNATYKIDEDKIPDQETFVRCSKCSTPISLNRQDQTALSMQQPQKIVECNECGTRYSIPLDKVGVGSIPVRCGKCGNVFEVSADDTETDVSYEDEGITSDPDDVSMDNIDIPEESNIEVDGLFDEIDEEEDAAFDSPDEFRSIDDFEDPELEDDEFYDEPKGPTEAYLESVTLNSQTDTEIDEDSELDEIGGEEKFDLFLKPNPVNQADGSAAKQLEPEDNEWPDIHDETGPPDTELDDFVELDDLGEIPASTDYDTDNPLELQEMDIKKGGSRTIVVVLLVVLLVILAAAAWFLLQTGPPSTTTPPPVESFSQQTRLKLLEPLKGRFATNKASGEKIFMLEGQIRNDYPGQTVINWIEVKGVLFDKRRTVLSESTAYAGKIITAETLEKATIAELKAIREDNVDEMDLGLEAQQTVPFQILFFKAGSNIQKLQAQINRFSRKQTP